MDEGTRYVAQWSRSPSSQSFLEYYVADDLSTTVPLHYLTCEPVGTGQVKEECWDYQYCRYSSLLLYYDEVLIQSQIQ